MKNERQAKILEIIKAESIETQEQLQQSIFNLGIHCTQATISRDIKQLHLIKEPIGQGKYRYAISIQRKRLNIADKLRTILRESIVSVNYAQNLVVIKTYPGIASAVAGGIDRMSLEGILGCVAGDDTIMVVTRDNECAQTFADRLHDLLRNM